MLAARGMVADTQPQPLSALQQPGSPATSPVLQTSSDLSSSSVASPHARYVAPEMLQPLDSAEGDILSAAAIGVLESEMIGTANESFSFAVNADELVTAMSNPFPSTSADGGFGTLQAAGLDAMGDAQTSINDAMAADFGSMDISSLDNSLPQPLIPSDDISALLAYNNDSGTEASDPFRITRV